jgi:hypothetical protein
MDNRLTIPLDTTERDGTRRTDEERERDRVLVARMYVRGKSQYEMSQELSKNYSIRVSPLAINSDLQTIRRMWRESTLLDFDAAKNKELARLDEAEREAWSAWERSKEKLVKREYEVTDDQVAFSIDKIADVKRTKKRKIVEEVTGDIRYLEMVERMIDTRCKILGLYEAQRVQVDWRTEAQQSGMNDQMIDSVREKTINTLLEAIAQASEIKESDIIDVETND